PFWLVWRSRFVSSALTELLLVPVCVGAVRPALPLLRRAPWRRMLEPALLMAFTLLLGLVVFGGSYHGAQGGGWSGAPVRSIALLLAPLLWAAVRFGPAAASFSLLTMTSMLVWGETHGRGLLTGLAPGEAVLACQSVLWVVAVPLLCLAALMQEHRKAEELVRGRLHFETLLSRLSTDFVPLASHQMEATFESWAARIGESFEVDRFMILLLRGASEVEIAYAWAAPGVLPPGAGLVGAGPAREVLRDQLLVLERLRAAPADPPAPLDRSGHALSVPLQAGGRTTGVVSLVRRSAGQAWPEELIQRLRLIADVLAGALARKTTEDALRRSEAMKSAILASMPTSVAVLDRHVRIVAVNEEWSRSAEEWTSGSERAGRSRPWDLFGAADGARCGPALTSGVSAVLQGSLGSFSHEFVCGRGPEER